MNPSRQVQVVYDQQCPACSYYCNRVTIRDSAGELVLVDARQAGPTMAEITAKGLDIDQGMVVTVGDEFYYGADALHLLARMGTNRGLFNRVTNWLFRSRTVARILYPLLRGCRNLLLKALGKTKINNLGRRGADRF